ncbi:Clp protease N-terminal domain-containing protein [Actinocrispum sp. NPDC049592]|uniref:Clp protease N-terminal domain-containing protein n=1 Tax=Actinocrispum sp. NPDC049592 TaxID=3154835 RepID=UPI00344AD42D
MFERFTSEARQVVVQAQVAAGELRHDFIGTEHLLIALFDAPDSVATRALRRLGMTKDSVRTDVETIIGRGEEASPGRHIPFTQRAKKVLELALREARRLDRNHIGPEHILLALVREGEGVAARILVERAGTLARVRQVLMGELAGETVGAQGGKHKATSAAEDAYSAAEALAGAAPVGSHHLLEALVRSEGSMAARVLADLGVDAEVLAAKLDELDPETTTDATPEEAAARKMELRMGTDEAHLVFRDEQTLELVQKIIDLTGGPVRGTGPVAGAFVPLWTSTNELLAKLLEYLESEPAAEESPKGLSHMMRRVMRSRLRRAPDA